MDKLTGWRTVAANAVVALLAAANAKFDFIDLSGDEQAAVALTVVAVLNIALRFVTRTPIFKDK